MNYKLVISYNGKNYNGWQVQPNLITVQGEVEKCLSGIFNERIKTIASGRTDAKVSALNQVINFFSNTKINEYSLLCRLNFNLPNDIQVISAEVVKDSFNARFDATSKTYAYNFYLSKINKPYLDDYCNKVSYKLDTEKLEHELKSLVGTHDFTALSSVDTNVENKIRTIMEVKLIKNGEVYTAIFVGSGFLKNMIRIIMGTAFDIARGKLSSSLLHIIETKNRANGGKTAGAVGLVLIDVNYDK